MCCKIDIMKHLGYGIYEFNSQQVITNIQKECIKSVVLWQTREVKAYKQVVETLA